MEGVSQVVLEHAEKVFEAQALVLDQTESIVAGLSDADIRARQAEINARLARLRLRLEQIDDVRIVGADGFLLAASRPEPLTQPDYRDRDIFRLLRDGGVPPDESFVSSVRASRIRQESVFFVGRQRRGGEPDIGGFSGIVLVSISPSYFRDFYAEVAKTVPAAIALFKASGDRLARYPTGVGDDTRVLTLAAFQRAVALAPNAGAYESKDSDDGRDRIVAYRKLASMPVYVGAGIERREVVRQWAAGLIPYLLLGGIAAGVLALLVRLARRRMLGEQKALLQLRIETERREDTEAQLRQSQKMDAIGRLTGGIAHDFNNLLTIISGSLDLLERRIGGADPRVVRLLENARGGATRAAVLTQQLLAFARRQPLAPRPTDIDKLVTNLGSLLERTLGDLVTIDCRLRIGAWHAIIDPPQLENALVNLAVNARDAMPTGGRITLETGLADVTEDTRVQDGDAAPGPYLTITVIDTGSGIAPAILDKVVEPFFTTKPTGQGTGLGLSQVFGFARQSGGAIVIHSSLGAGTRVRLLLPRHAGALPTTEDAASAIPVKPHAADVTILVAEDDADVRGIATETLVDLGYRVLTAVNGADALQQLAAKPAVRLLLTDVVMPVMDGRKLAQDAKRLLPELPVVFMTGYAPDEIARKGALDADLHLLTKPFTRQQLAKTIETALADAATKAGAVSRTSSSL